MEGSVYLKARQGWDERYADLVLGKRNWQITAAGMMAITLVLAFGMVWVSTRSKFVPYVVEVDKLGYAIGAPSALTENTTRISTDRMVRYELAAFIRNAREVITDPAAEHQLIGQVYSRARGPAYKFLENYYHENDLEHDPFKVAQHQSVSVQIDSILPLSKATWQVRWTEEASGLDGSPVATTHWEAALDTSIISETSDSSILENPLGFYVTQLNWTRAAELGGDHHEVHWQIWFHRALADARRRNGYQRACTRAGRPDGTRSRNAP
jgi:type IV secretory pathway TrbF-like protein